MAKSVTSSGPAMILFSTQDDKRKIEIEVEEIKKIIMVGRKTGVERDDRRENRRMKIRGNIQTKETNKKRRPAYLPLYVQCCTVVPGAESQ